MTAVQMNLSLNSLSHGVLFHQYKLLEQIGAGGQGVVWSALDQSQGCIYAIKFNNIIDTDEAKADDIRDEHQLEQLVKLRHVHILPLHEYGFDEQIRFTVSPYVPGGTLAEKIKASPPSLDETLRYGTEIASALDYLHSQGIIHRDLKSSNILLDMNRNVYLADFGLARMVSTSTLAFHTGHGTPPYAPPEQIQLKAITPRSDIFSFGILLYEMFTGQLPWNGKKQLGLEQSHSKQEIPDPREFNEDLPAQVVEVLRRVTSADPELRPNSSGEVMRMLHNVLKSTLDLQPADTAHNKPVNETQDVEGLLEHGLERWHSSNGTYNLGLTKFALIDLARTSINMKIFSRFMLSQALTYGYNDDQWWSVVDNPRERLAVSSDLLRKKNETITARIIGRLINDADIRLFPPEMLETLTTSLLEIGTNSDNIFLRQQIFDGIRILIEPVSTWNEITPPEDPVKRLGELALEDSEAGDSAAELIGHLRSSSAVQVVLDHADQEKKLATLLLIQEAAGSLPAFVQGGIRFRLFLEWIVHQAFQQPASLVSAYAMAFLGAALGFGLQVYLTYRLPEFIDFARITTSLEQGVIIGAIFGLGILADRVIMERFQTFSPILRVALGTIIGGLGMNIALFIFHVLFLNTPPMGLLVTAGCMLIALTFAVGSLLPSRPVRMGLSIASILITITGTWLIHVNAAASSVTLTPMLRYEYAWPFTQVVYTALGVAFFLGVFGNSIDLSVTDE